MGNFFICYDKKILQELDEDMREIAAEICDIYPPNYEEFNNQRKMKRQYMDISENKNIAL